MEQDQALQPGDAVEWTNEDHWTEMGKLYEQIAFQNKRIDVLKSVRDELQRINAQLRADNAAIQTEKAVVTPMERHQQEDEERQTEAPGPTHNDEGANGVTPLPEKRKP